MWQQARAVLAGLVGGFVVSGYDIWIGTKDPLTLTFRGLVAVAVVWGIAELLQTRLVRSRLPIVWVGFGKEGRQLTKESDAALAGRIDKVVSGISAITANYIRYQPNTAPGPDLTAWQRGVEE